MTGRIKMYNNTKSFGFIAGDDEQDYFFHATGLKSEEYPAPGRLVEFSPDRGPKGPIAKKISIIETKYNRPSFITIGTTRIRLSDIKSYEITTDLLHYCTIYDATTFQKIGDAPIDEGSYREAVGTAKIYDPVQKIYIRPNHYRLLQSDGGKLSVDTVWDEQDLHLKHNDMLLIRTYQNEEYSLFEDVAKRLGIDIYEKMHELDSYFLTP